MDEDLGAATGLLPIARNIALASGVSDAASVGRALTLGRSPVAFARTMAADYDRAPRLRWSPSVRSAYRSWAWNNLAQYRAARAAGIDIWPWSEPTQPYCDSAELVRSVRRTGTLYVYLTAVGHGPAGSTGFHPLRARSGIVERGVELTHNDVFRAVHDLFGHVLTGCDFGLRGELAAAGAHARLYSTGARLVLLTEHVGQVCWFFHGPHRANEGAEPAVAERPYPLQKVFLYPAHRLASFASLFKEPSS
jgi:hypothetical protein